VKIIPDLIQGSPEWLAARKGRPTASRFSDIVTAAKADLSKSAEGYMHELIGECFCPEFQYFAGNAATERGKLLEPEAREAFQAETGLVIHEVGLCISADEVSGCSPDGLIYDGEIPVAGLEIKCPSPKVHVSYVLAGVLPAEYRQQVHGSMAVTGLGEWHFWSYYPGMRHLHVIVKRDEYTEKLAASLAEFVAAYKALLKTAIPLLSVAINS